MNTSNFQIQPDEPWLTLDAFMKMLTLRLARAMGVSPEAMRRIHEDWNK